MILTSVIVSSPGCEATFRRGNLDRVTALPMASTKSQKPIAVAVTLEAYQNDSKVRELVLARMLPATVLEEYRESGWFSDVVPAPFDAELQMETTITLHRWFSMPQAFLTVFTLGLTPTWATFELRVTTVFRDRSEHLLGSFDRSQRLFSFAHISMIVLRPFKSPNRVIKECVRDMHRQMLMEARKAGAI